MKKFIIAIALAFGLLLYANSRLPAGPPNQATVDYAADADTIPNRMLVGVVLYTTTSWNLENYVVFKVATGRAIDGTRLTFVATPLNGKWMVYNGGDTGDSGDDQNRVASY